MCSIELSLQLNQFKICIRIFVQGIIALTFEYILYWYLQQFPLFNKINICINILLIEIKLHSDLASCGALRGKQIPQVTSKFIKNV